MESIKETNQQLPRNTPIFIVNLNNFSENDVSNQSKKTYCGRPNSNPVWGYFSVGEYTGEKLWRNNMAKEEKTVKQKCKTESNIRLNSLNIEVITEERQ
ncbi:10406_t:CDS:2 [Dentiscutata erythropus]|uniref:10406_t:CDS:1 n=1 Tax=Dentiscutata erythropus TaxID=1348616 RepID=A0A9N9ND69_9GLOM|nr:10406_t:CDS:2 [Dentiscutata erythropus]